MLVLTRKMNEQFLIGDDIVITVCRIRGDKVRIGIDAPKSVKIMRSEISNQIKEVAVEQKFTPLAEQKKPKTKSSLSQWMNDADSIH